MLGAYFIFIGSLALFGFLGSMSGGLFLSLVVGAAAYHIVGRVKGFPVGEPITLTKIGEAIARGKFLKILDVRDEWYERRDLQNFMNYTYGTMVITTWVLHIYLVPLLLAEKLDLGMTDWWMEFTDPVLGWVGGLSTSVRNFTRDLNYVGHPERILIVRHVHGVVFMSMAVAVICTLVNFRRIVQAPLNMAKAAAHAFPSAKPLNLKKKTYIRVTIQILLSCIFIWFGIYTIFFREGIRRPYVSVEGERVNYNTIWFGGTVHVDNLALLDVAWLTPLITHGLFLGMVLACIGLIAFVFERRRLRVAK